MKLDGFVLLLAGWLAAGTAYSQARNVILFVGDGAGVSSINAASIYGYGKPLALSIQKWPNVALVETSTEKEWVTDSAGFATAIMTGHKGRVAYVSVSPDPGSDGKHTAYKTFVEYAMERGLSTGLVSNAERTGILAGFMVPFYSHGAGKNQATELFDQALNPKYSKGPDFMLGPCRKYITEAYRSEGRADPAAAIQAKGYAYPDSMAALAQLDPAQSRVMAFLNEPDFDLEPAVKQAVARLSRNPKGYFLAVHSDCHLAKARPSLERLVALDKVVKTISEQVGDDTLVLFTADHGYDLRIKGEKLTGARKMEDHKKILAVVSLEDEHTAEEVALFAKGPGADRVKGYIPNTEIFHLLMRNYGWESTESAYAK